MKLNQPSQFAEVFLERYLHDGLGRMQKRDIDVLVFYLLLQDGQYNLPDDIFKAGRELGLTETRVRNLYQDVQLRFMQYDEDEAMRQLVEVVETGAIERSGEKLTFIIRDPLLRQYFEEWVAAEDGFTDSRFNKNLVVVTVDVLTRVLSRLGTEDTERIRVALPPEFGDALASPDRPGLMSAFTQEFARAAGKETGSLSVQLIGTGLRAILGL